MRLIYFYKHASMKALTCGQGHMSDTEGSPQELRPNRVSLTLRLGPRSPISAALGSLRKEGG